MNIFLIVGITVVLFIIVAYINYRNNLKQKTLDYYNRYKDRDIKTVEFESKTEHIIRIDTKRQVILVDGEIVLAYTKTENGMGAGWSFLIDKRFVPGVCFEVTLVPDGFIVVWGNDEKDNLYHVAYHIL